MQSGEGEVSNDYNGMNVRKVGKGIVSNDDCSNTLIKHTTPIVSR